MRAIKKASAQEAAMHVMGATPCTLQRMTANDGGALWGAVFGRRAMQVRSPSFQPQQKSHVHFGSSGVFVATVCDILSNL